MSAACLRAVYALRAACQHFYTFARAQSSLYPALGRGIRPEFGNERNPRHSCQLSEVVKMVRQKYVYWRDDDMWLGYLEEFPVYWTQGETEYYQAPQRGQHLIDFLPGFYYDLAPFPRSA